jgi:hypothetical protein
MNLRSGHAGFIAVALALIAAAPTSAQAPRKDVMWARKAPGPIALDGVLNEPAWAAAESVTIQWATNAGIPGSGWKAEGGVLPSNPTTATIKLLVVGNQMYLGAEVQDASVGGSKDFNRFDGFLMALKDHSSTGAPKPPAEYLYSWWYPSLTDPQAPGKEPGFIGRWATFPPSTPRDSTQIANWDARTVVHGQSNNDGVADTGYTVEMRFNLTPMGYDVTQPGGDIVEWNISIYDCDWLWPLNAPILSYNRVWFQSPWGNAAWYDEVHVYADPTVTTTSGPVPNVGPELVVPYIDASPTIDGSLTEGVWTNPNVYQFDLRYGDDALRASYPGVGPDRSGQYQPPINGTEAFVFDPADATIKRFHRDDFLYVGFDVRDEYVQFHPVFDRWDGFLVMINDRAVESPDHSLLGKRLGFQVGPAGTALPSDDLATLVMSGDALVQVHLNTGTVVDTVGFQVDNGYTAELRVDLKALGYPAGLGDRAFFVGIDHMDGDSFVPSTDSYGTRTWWFREYEGDCCPAWAHLAPNPVGVQDLAVERPSGYQLLRTYPNPAQYATIQYTLPRDSDVTIEVFDVAGRLVERRELGLQSAGIRDASIDGRERPAGVYLYRLTAMDPSDGSLRASLSGKVVLVK